nr:hypothetical protein [Kibdelosporangium sp. MJ126-NF4]
MRVQLNALESYRRRSIHRVDRGECSMIEDVDLEIAFEPYSQDYDKPIDEIFGFVSRPER